MSADVAKAVINEALDLSYAFRQNAALKNGLPDCQKNRIDSLSEPKDPSPPVVNITNQIPAAPAATNSPSPGSGAAQDKEKSLLQKAAPYLLTAATALGGGALGAWALNKPATVIEQPGDGSLLQYLEDNGQHLPEADQWQQK